MAPRFGLAGHEGGGAAKADNIDFAKPADPWPPTLGYDYSCIIPASLDMDPYCWLENGRLVEAPTGHTPGSERRWSGGGGYWRAGAIAPSFDFYQVLPTIATKSVDFIKRQTPDRPFFLYAALTAPHTPWMPTPEFRGKTKVDWYGDFVTEVDWAMGQIVKAVDDAGLGDNTIVIFTSDNGSHWPADQIAKFNHRANGPCAGRNPTFTKAATASPSSAAGPAGSSPARKAVRRSA